MYKNTTTFTGDIMKSKRSAATLLTLVLTTIAILMTFSCTGLLTPRNQHSGTGTLCIALPGSQARAESIFSDVLTVINTPDTVVDYCLVSVISEDSGEVIIHSEKVTEGTFSAELSAGSYSVIIQGMNADDPEGTESPLWRFMRDSNMPFYIGRKNSVTIRGGETTTADVTMRRIFISESDLETISQANNNITFDGSDIGIGKMPVLSKGGETFDGWYSDSTSLRRLTDIPDTTSDTYFEIEPRYVKSNVVYATQNGSGDGTTPWKPTNIISAFTALYNIPNATLYLLGNVELPSNYVVMTDVTIIGAGGSSGTGKVIITGEGTPVSAFSSGTHTVRNVIVDGGDNTKIGIKILGATITLEDCEIRNCGMGIFNNGGSCTLDSCTVTACIAPDADKHAVYNYQGSLTVKNYSTISNCSSQLNGGGIYCQGSSSSLSFDSTSSITGCTAVSAGGGIYIYSDANGSAMRICGSITNCSAASGGGICNYGQGELQLSGCTITGCKATGEDVDKRGNGTGYGGGIFTGQAVSFDNATSINGCTATEHGNSIYGQVNSTLGTAAKVNGTDFTKSAYYDGDVENTTSLTFTDM